MNLGDSLREPTFLILTALALAPLHGYGIISEVAMLSGGRLSLRPGTLYGALDRLADEGLVEPDREEVVDGRLRRYYRLTEAGVGLLTAEAERLRSNADAAQSRLARRGPVPRTPRAARDTGAARAPAPGRPGSPRSGLAGAPALGLGAAGGAG